VRAAPETRGDQHAHQLYLQAIRSAHDSLTIENVHFLPPAFVCARPLGHTASCRST
jgi:phosphatidylserine/phosphatidylglycerophosphate/cardiolipin synthase-like enzyme